MTKYTSALGDKICQLTIHAVVGLRHICAELKLPYSTITSWIYNEKHELHNMYASAKLLQIDRLMEEMLEIADDNSDDYMTVVDKNGQANQVMSRMAFARCRLRIKVRQTIIAKLAPIRKIQKNQKASEEEKSRAGKKIMAPSSPKNTLKPGTGTNIRVGAAAQKVTKSASLTPEKTRIPRNQGGRGQNR